jgi:NADPH:quinone reductase-like Zn-dependent oxidoreductase
VSFGEPAGLRELFHILVTMVIVNLKPDGKSLKLYGTSNYFLGNRKPFMKDWATLLKLLEQGDIKPIIAADFPLLDAAKANALLESGQVTGNVVLLTTE